VIDRPQTVNYEDKTVCRERLGSNACTRLPISFKLGMVCEFVHEDVWKSGGIAPHILLLGENSIGALWVGD
jgi:hypothetical protein